VRLRQAGVNRSWLARIDGLGIGCNSLLVSTAARRWFELGIIENSERNWCGTHFVQVFARNLRQSQMRTICGKLQGILTMRQRLRAPLDKAIAFLW
jgi:hypothetical protein